ncbi:MAG: DUF6463 family protein, partial [Bacteroidota bacterium]
IIAIGIIHTIFGLIFFGHIGKILLEEGLFNTVNGQMDREAFFWFIMSGLLFIVIGSLVHWIEQQPVAFPRMVSIALLSFTLPALLIMPASGVWLFFAPIIGAYLKSRKRTAPLSAGLHS